MSEELKSITYYKEKIQNLKKSNRKYREPIVITTDCLRCNYEYNINDSIHIHMHHMLKEIREKYGLLYIDDSKANMILKKYMWFNITNYSTKNFEYDEEKDKLHYDYIYGEMIKSNIWKKTKVKRVLNVYIADVCVLTLIINNSELYMIRKQINKGNEIQYIYGGCRKGAGRKPMDETHKQEIKEYRKLVRLTKTQYEALNDIRLKRQKPTGWSTILREIVEEYIEKNKN